MKALQYKIEVSNSVTDALHGFKSNITEIFVPKYKLAFNELGGLFNTDIPRAKKTTEIKVTKADMDAFLEYLIRKDNCKIVIKKYFPKVDNIL